jgi:hypothetical protein
MLSTTPAAWIRRAVTLFALAGVLALAACGGGSGAPNNPYAPVPTPPGPLTVVPPEATAYPGTPLVLSISGGVPPYTAFSGNPAALPVPQNVIGSTLTLNANPVESAQVAPVTIRDSAGSAALAEVTVRPAVLLPASIAITPNGAPCPGGEVCSGQTSVATVRVTGPAGAPLAGRSVRFDVVQGAYALQTTNPGSPLAATQTVVSDANGDARVVLAVAPNTPTQIGLLRATELTTGSQVTSQFIIQQVTDGSQVLSVAPVGTTTITGPAQNVCSTGVRVSHYIFGGTPPYTVLPNFPDVAALVGSPVLVNGGGFDFITNGTCFTGLTFAIRDATGRVLAGGLSTINNSPGTAVAPTPPTALQVSAPGAGSSTSRLNCVAGTTVSIVITGRAPFSAASPQNLILAPNPVGASPGTLNVSGLYNGTPGNPNTFTVTIGDASTPQQLASVQIFCN